MTERDGNPEDEKLIERMSRAACLTIGRKAGARAGWGMFDKDQPSLALASPECCASSAGGHSTCAFEGAIPRMPPATVNM